MMMKNGLCLMQNLVVRMRFSVESRQVKKDDYLLVDGLHETLVSEEVWEQFQMV